MPASEDLARRRRHRPLDLEPDRLAEAPPAELLLDRQEQVVGLVLLDREVGVAGHPEQVVLEDLHAGNSVSRLASMTWSMSTKRRRLDLDRGAAGSAAP